MARPENLRLLAALKYGHWIRTRAAPYRAVVWCPEERADGTTSNRGRAWREVLGVGERRQPETFLAAEVVLAPPSEPMDYCPSPDEPVCGYLLGREPDRYCPRYRAKDAFFCPQHEAEFTDQGEESPSE